MKTLISFCIILTTQILSVSANAFVFIGLGAEGRLTKNVDDDYKFKTPVLVYTGYGQLPWAIAFEALTYSEDSKTSGFYNISVKHYELGVYGLRFFNYENSSLINPYVTAGVGVLKEKIETTLGGTTQSDDSDTYLMGKVGLGLWSTIAENYFINLEVKAMLSEGLDPKMMFNLAFRTGVQF